MKTSHLVLLLLSMVLVACSRPEPTTRLTLAATNEDPFAVQKLLASGVAPDEFDENGMTPLMWAAWYDRTASVDTLLKAGAKPNLPDRRPNHFPGSASGWSPLLVAVHHDSRASAAALLRNGANVNQTSNEGTTPLMMAAGQGDLELVQLLLRSGANPRLEGNMGNDALANAIANGHQPIVEELLRTAPDLRLKNNLAGRISRLIATLRGRGDLVTRANGC